MTPQHQERRCHKSGGWLTVTPGLLLLFCLGAITLSCGDDSTDSEPWNLEEHYRSHSGLTVSIRPPSNGMGALYPMSVCIDDPEGCLRFTLVHLEGMEADRDCSDSDYCVDLPSEWRLESRSTPRFYPPSSSENTVTGRYIPASRMSGTVSFSSPPAPPRRIDELSLEVEFEDPPANFPESLNLEATDIRVE